MLNLIALFEPIMSTLHRKCSDKPLETKTFFSKLPPQTHLSHQKGMGKRPHRTLKERVQCLLYCVAFRTEFWSDGLLHSVWLYNRTFHKALDMSPYEAYTKQKPTVDGSCIVAKKAKRRHNDADPNAYNGVFVG
jgi:hypothetical protein